MKNLLEIKDIHASINNKEIIKGLSLEIKPGEVHAIMGPNGSGKSTLSNVLTRHPDYDLTSGKINFLDQDISNLEPEECARIGLFLSFQYPVSIPGVSNVQFIKSSVNAIRKHQGLKPLDAIDFLNLIKSTMKTLGMKEELLQRYLNDGFSGGEKKRNEILQMTLLNPKLAILDETDSGLDIDALKAVSLGINNFKNKDNGILLITHYQRLLDYVTPDFVHIMKDGKIIHSGDKNLALELEEKGYADYVG